MQTKYIVVLGSLLSGLGKGVVTASISKILDFYDCRSMPMKFDGYLNYDCGTMNPFRHGEVFVLDDKSEVDMDFGTYERFVGADMDGSLSITGGKLFSELIKKERKGDFLGRDVQFIPHLTDLIISKIRDASERLKLDFLIIEVGGTVGDIENSYFIEAMRQLSLAEKTVFVNLTYVPRLSSVGEQKTKPTQIANRNLMQLGIRTDIMVCRAETKLSSEVKQKIALFSNISQDMIIEDPEIDNVYSMPLEFMEQGMDKAIFGKLEIKAPKLNRLKVEAWANATKGMRRHKNKVRIAIVGKYTNLKDSYASVSAAVEHSANWHKINPEIVWIESDLIKDDDSAKSALGNISGMIIPGGFGKRGTEGMIKAIEYARTNGIPCLGICLGMQLMAIEYARNVCGIKDADSSEFNRRAANKIIDLMENQRSLEEKGGNMRLGSWPMSIRENTLAMEAYGSDKAAERHRHRYEFNNAFRTEMEKHGFVFSGISPDGELVEIIEWPNGKGIGTQSHPEFKSRPERPSPLFNVLIKRASDYLKFSA